MTNRPHTSFALIVLAVMACGGDHDAEKGTLDRAIETTKEILEAKETMEKGIQKTQEALDKNRDISYEGTSLKPLTIPYGTTIHFGDSTFVFTGDTSFLSK